MNLSGYIRDYVRMKWNVGITARFNSSIFTIDLLLILVPQCDYWFHGKPLSIYCLYPTQTLFIAENELVHKRNYSGVSYHLGIEIIIYDIISDFKEEELFLESNLLLATQSPICLDPSTDVVCVSNRLSYNQQKFNDQSVERYLHQRSHASRYQKCFKRTPKGLLIHDFMAQRNTLGHRQVRILMCASTFISPSSSSFSFSM